MSGNQTNRNIGAAGLFIIFSLLFFVLVIRFITIQYTGEAEGRVLAAKAAQMYLRQDVIKAKRGTIYDQKGEVIAEDSASYTLVAVLDEKLTIDESHPNHVVDPEETASQLAKQIDMSEQDILSLLTKEGRKQVEFGQAGRDLSHNVKKKIEQLKLPGITFIKDSKRFYPNGIFASHLIGYAQKEETKGNTSEIIGKTGLEKSYNKLLKGADGSIKYDGDKWNYILPNSEKQIKKPKNGHDIYLTIDKKIQTFLEDAMNKVDEEYKPKRIMAVVADPKTGRILAMGQRPTYHPTTRVGIDQSWHNEIIETSFEPGSTMKVFSLAAAIEEKVFNPKEKFPSGTYVINNKSKPIKDHNQGVGWGPITYLEGVQRSSNVGFAYLLEKMGTDTWRHYIDEFKFGTETGIALPNEVPGKILYDWPIEKVTSVFGQGTTVTAMQMVQAMTAIAGDGQMMKPYVVDKILNSDEDTVLETKPEIAGRPISKETAKEVREILETVLTSEHGTGEIYQLDGYKSAGKTGTAQIPNPSGGYLEGRNNFIFSFLGLAPVENTKLVMFVSVEQPNLAENESGSVPVSKIYNTVMKNSLQYLNIEPEDIPEAKITTLPDFSKLKINETMKILKKSGLKPVIIGKGNKITGQSPLDGVTMIEGEKIIIRTDGELTIPDMSGWSKRDVLKAAQLAGLKVNIVGNGFAFKQNLKPNSPIAEGDHLVVNFETPQQKLEREKMNNTTEKEDSPRD
ncbi:penicillin-binding protein [Lederbergia citrea]|uniref:penicillin-binding protein n=1 Tax=Lederbergia citrea TaxID=2833581 RepID=UPI001BC93389|nr:penicillin-binding protein [Lederbergia citrea]MBS4177216.1 penicillin-binding protein [Lederbergia citrea]